jgi:hypothetical protein
MYIDKNLTVAGTLSTSGLAGQTITGSAGSAVSENSINLSSVRDVGAGEPLNALFTVTTAITGTSGVEMDVILASDALLVNDIEVVGSTGAIPVGELTVNKMFDVTCRPLIGKQGKQYMGTRFTRTGTVSTGAVSCTFVETIQDGKKSYASGYTV